MCVHNVCSDDADMEQELIQHAKSSVQPGVAYYIVPSVVNKHEGATRSI